MRRLDDDLIARVEDVVRLTPTIVEVIVQRAGGGAALSPRAVLPAAELRVGVAPRGGGVPLLMEGIALTGAWVDKEQGLLSLIALELGVSSRLVAYLRRASRSW